MKKYESFQLTWILLVTGPIMIWVYYLYYNQIGSKPISLEAMLLLEGLAALFIVLFYGLKITLTDELIKLSYGIGLITIKIKVADIKSTKIVRNPWYYGLGIRIIPNGMLYNAHGLSAVELTFYNKKRIVRIGSPDCDTLKKELDKRLEFV